MARPGDTVRPGDMARPGDKVLPGDTVRPGEARRAEPTVDLDEATRQLELAAHDIAVATSCIALEDLDAAHTSVITARAAADAAEEILRVSLGLAPSRTF
jgi:hypothetical protein